MLPKPAPTICTSPSPLTVTTDELLVEYVAVATPASGVKVAVVRVPPPSWNVTSPVGTPEPGDLAVTVTVIVTLWPKTDGLDDDVTVVVELDWPTVWVNKERSPQSNTGKFNRDAGAAFALLALLETK